MIQKLLLNTQMIWKNIEEYNEKTPKNIDRI